MPNTRHKWTASEEQDSQRLSWSEFNTKYNRGPGGQRITFDAYRLRRQRLRHAASMTRSSSDLKVTTGAVLAGCLVALVVMLAIVPLVFMVLWNAVVPGVFHGPSLDFVQALALTWLLSIIGGFFRRSGGSK